MKIYTKKYKLKTKQQFEVVDITQSVLQSVEESAVRNGIAVLFCGHTTASIKLNHYEPLLFQDIMKALYDIAPVAVNYAHDVFEIRQNVSLNERSNAHAHVKAFIMGSSETVPVDDGVLAIGKRQSVFFVELDGGRDREFTVKIIGE